MQKICHDERVTRHQEGEGALPIVRCVQWLRYVAAALVVLYHCEVQIMRLDSSAAHRFGIGAAGVDLFFVISGFIMVHTTQRRGMTFKSFMTRRLIRIVPLYWIFTSMLVFLVAVVPSLFHSSALDVAHVVSSFAFLPHPHPVSGELRPLLVPGWTLNAEMFFYLCFGATLGLTLERRIIALAVLFISIAGLAAATDMPSRLLAFYGAPLMLEFVAGMAIAWILLNCGLTQRAVATLVGVGVLLGGAGIWSGISEQPIRVIYWGGTAVCGLLACLWIEREHGWFELPLMVRLGDASYAIYLSHLFVLGLAGSVISRLGIFSTIGASGTRIIMLLMATAFGLAVHNWIEVPILAYLRGRRRGAAALIQITDGRAEGRDL